MNPKVWNSIPRHGIVSLSDARDKTKNIQFLSRVGRLEASSIASIFFLSERCEVVNRKGVLWTSVYHGYIFSNLAIQSVKCHWDDLQWIPQATFGIKWGTCIQRRMKKNFKETYAWIVCYIQHLLDPPEAWSVRLELKYERILEEKLIVELRHADNVVNCVLQKLDPQTEPSHLWRVLLFRKGREVQVVYLIS